ncbi:MAG: 50S ribosomal protein L24 [Legionellaceae bacterium]|nr:50S ribosomal protein L24 [Legionellaceae bacterium]
MKRIKKGDTVVVTTGRSKNHVGKILRLKENKVIVEGANLVTKHVKPNPNLQIEGGRIQKESLIHVSNVALYNPTTKKADKVGFRFVDKNGSQVKVRYFKSNQEIVDQV